VRASLLAQEGCEEGDVSSCRHEFTISNWTPTPLNKLMRSVRARIRLKKADRDLVAVYARQADVPRARGKRRVTLLVTLGPGQRGADVDSYWKSLLDALVYAQLLVDDSQYGVELAPVEFARGPALSTTIVLEDLE
jgi:hypothetical protein